MAKPSEPRERAAVASTDHPHGPEDPRWIDEEGRCVLCGRDYWESEARRLARRVAALESLLAERAPADSGHLPDCDGTWPCSCVTRVLGVGPTQAMLDTPPADSDTARLAEADVVLARSHIDWLIGFLSVQDQERFGAALRQAEAARTALSRRAAADEVDPHEHREG